MHTTWCAGAVILLKSYSFRQSVHGAHARKEVQHQSCAPVNDSDIVSLVNSALRCSTFNATTVPCDCLAASLYCNAGSACAQGVFCYLCSYSRSSLAPEAAAFCFTCPCGQVWRDQWKCPQDPTQTLTPEVSYPSAFLDRDDFQRSWHFTVGKLIPKNPNLAPFSFHFTFVRFSTLPNVRSSPTTVAQVQIAVGNPNTPAPANGYNHRLRAVPVEFVATVYNEPLHLFKAIYGPNFVWGTSPLNNKPPGTRGAMYVRAYFCLPKCARF